jgi:DNA-binding response OmpR family regulator
LEPISARSHQRDRNYTAYGNPKDRVRAVRSGAVAFLHKPLNDEELLEAINSALKQYFVISNIPTILGNTTFRGTRYLIRLSKGYSLYREIQ